MNREIEFRIWDNDDKHFLSLDDFQKMGCVMINNDGTLFLSSDYRFMLNMMIKLDKYTIQQYTGLKDKNSKKIFEGDIITNCITNTKFIVKFYDTRFMLAKLNNEDLEEVEMYNFLHRMNSLFEVIGNIYEDNLESKGDE